MGGRARESYTAQARYALLLAVLFGAGALAIRWGMAGRRATASAAEAVPRPVVADRLTPNEQRNFQFRLHQLEQDLKRDGTDYDVLRRLGRLHCELAGCQYERRGYHLRRARFYLLRAAEVALTSREAQYAKELLDAANSPNPAADLFGMPIDLGPPQRVEEELLRMRLGWLEEQVTVHPRCSRLLCRVGDNYTALSLAMQHDERRHPSSWPGASAVSDPDEARLLAEQAYRRALECATTHEARSRALYGQAELYRVLDEPARAAAILQQVLALQPNNWFAALEMARLCRQLNQVDEAERYQLLSARWRTPGWI